MNAIWLFDSHSHDPDGPEWPHLQEVVSGLTIAVRYKLAENEDAGGEPRAAARQWNVTRYEATYDPEDPKAEGDDVASGLTKPEAFKLLDHIVTKLCAVNVRETFVDD